MEFQTTVAFLSGMWQILSLTSDVSHIERAYMMYIISNNIIGSAIVESFLYEDLKHDSDCTIDNKFQVNWPHIKCTKWIFIVNIKDQKQ